MDSEFYHLGESIDVSSFDGAVIGSAVYVGRWMHQALEFVHIHEEKLRTIPVWLFSSGPLGNDPGKAVSPEQLAELQTITGSREQRVFDGRLDRTRLNMGERQVASAVGAPEGDFRDWKQIGSCGVCQDSCRVFCDDIVSSSTFS